MKRLIVPALVVALLVVAALTMFTADERKTLTAEFPRTVSIYEGSDVRVLGIPVGTVDRIEPNGTSVKVTISYDADVDLPADVSALIVSPSVVGDRYIQLHPVYTGGEKLPDNANLGLDETQTPLELDEIYASLDELAVTLGPDGANSNGALTELLATAADNFEGQGEQFNQTIQDLGKLTGTLANNKDELFESAAELEGFINTLATNDQVVRDFNQAMASVSELLAGERDELASTLSNLSTALGAVQTFVKENKTLLATNIDGLERISQTLVKRRGELDEILRVAPVALNNLALTYNPVSGTLDTSANLENAAHELTNNPALFLCSIVGQADPTGQLCTVIDTLLGSLPLPRTGTFGAAAVTDPTFQALLEVAR
ncbi:MCE family protein [Nocardioides sp. AE5]|uniref:MCE family protein n=1 Tax=Nocardioides sp. AE5 TaxID=2962573 RepID=UPI002881087B|nr:MCE family protein [Nocardioides sp. AE5]MDT0200756.1 MCE family protein [Nocardioides sp. AE5]